MKSSCISLWAASFLLVLVWLPGPVYAQPTAKKLNAALMTAADYEDAAAVARLLASGAFVNARDFEGRTALHHAAMYGLSSYDENDFESQGDVSKRCAILSVMRLLIAHGANVNAAAKDGRTPLMLTAGFAQSPACVRLLLEHGANRQAKDKHGWSALKWGLWGQGKDSTDSDDAEVIALLEQKQPKQASKQ